MAATSFSQARRSVHLFTVLASAFASILLSGTTAFAKYQCHTLFRSQDDIERFLIRPSRSSGASEHPVSPAVEALLDPSIPRIVTSFAPLNARAESTAGKLERGETPEVTFADIARDTDRFERFIPRVYARIGSQRIGDELATLTVFLDRYGGHALSVGNYGHIDGLPTIDAVHFPRDPTQPPVNISIKSSTSRERTNAYNFVNGAITKAKRSLKDNYGFVGLTRLLGSRASGAEELFHILGYEYSGDRPAVLVIDLSLEVSQTPRLDRAGDVPRYRQLKGEAPTDILLTVSDSRVDAKENESYNRLNLSVLRREIRAATRAGRRAAYRDGAEFSEYRIMFADANVVVNAKDIRIDLLD